MLSLLSSLVIATIQKIYVFDLSTLVKEQEYSTYENEYGLVAINKKVMVIPDKERGALRILVSSGPFRSRVERQFRSASPGSSRQSDSKHRSVAFRFSFSVRFRKGNAHPCVQCKQRRANPGVPKGDRQDIGHAPADLQR